MAVEDTRNSVQTQVKPASGLNEELRADFARCFTALTRGEKGEGHEPLRWQERMYEKLYRNDVSDFPETCDLPTGMGKTSIICLWALALRRQCLDNKTRLPTRLVYVVDRRTVVDQATEIAEQIQRNLWSVGLADDWLSVSTLRGQFADNREWTRDPTKPAIIIGTVDMIGSRLLFSGYRSSYKLRPLDAGLLGQDSLLVLDEAHLSEPFKKLVDSLSNQGTFQRGQGSPMRVLSMSATASEGGLRRFQLEETDLEGDKETNPIQRRWDAPKRLCLEPPVEKKKLPEEIAKAALKLSEEKARVVVFVRSPDMALMIEKAVQKELQQKDCVRALTGTMRGLERDELLKTAVLRRFLDGEEKPEHRSGKEPAVLVSTSAGEVGFDLNADHMICDAAPLDSMIQRLGRVNRRGHGEATVRVFSAMADEKPPKANAKAEKAVAKKRTWGSAAAATLKCLERLPRDEHDRFDASPKALAELKTSLTNEQLEEALTPKPETVEVTDILLDRWSMTTIIGNMPGRPPVAPWLRGVSEEEPQTTVTWRKELDLDGFGQLDPSDLEEWFDAHSIQPHETLSVPVSKARDWLLDRWKALPEALQDNLSLKYCLVERSGLQALNIKVLVDKLNERTTPIASADIILPASFGGIERGEGLLLDRDSPAADQTEDGSLMAPDVADANVDGRQKRYRFVRTIGTGTEVEDSLGCELPRDRKGLSRFTLDLASAGDTVKQLVSLVPKTQRPEFGTTKQTLNEHVGLVKHYAAEISGRLILSNDVREAVTLAAHWHDDGKAREIWQQAAGRIGDEELVGKSGGSMKRIARGYRHEFGSIRKFGNEYEGQIADEVFDLAMHLIAAHHGRGRPHFPKGGFDPEAPAESPRLALDVIRRFARLQRRYGYWQLAWLENLLRCADAMASAEKGKKT